MKAAATTREIVLKLGEIHHCDSAVIMKCHGLGSCVALFLFDMKSMNAAGAHIVLPGHVEGTLWEANCYSENAVHALLGLMVSGGAALHNIRAGIVGGGNVANIESLEIGRENVESVLSQLQKHVIEVTHMEVGGTCTRTATFFSSTRKIEVTSVDTVINKDQN